jgi:hypothetical protein
LLSKWLEPSIAKLAHTQLMFNGRRQWFAHAPRVNASKWLEIKSFGKELRAKLSELKGKNSSGI